MPPWISRDGPAAGAGADVVRVRDQAVDALQAEVAEQARAVDARPDDDDGIAGRGRLGALQGALMGVLRGGVDGVHGSSLLDGSARRLGSAAQLRIATLMAEPPSAVASASPRPARPKRCVTKGATSMRRLAMRSSARSKCTRHRPKEPVTRISR